MTQKEVTVLEKKLVPIEDAAQDLVIKDDKTMEKAHTMLSQINTFKDEMEARKAKIYDPAWATVVAIRAAWKPQETKVEVLVKMIRSKMTVYQTEAKRKADTEAAKITDRIGEGKGKLKIDTAVRKIEEMDKPSESFATDSGVTKFKTVKKFEVMDMELLPMLYRLPNEPLIRKAMLEGHILPGVRYYEEQVPMNFR